MSKLSISALAGLAAVALSSVTAAPALASDLAYEPVEVRIEYRDLDLTDPADAARLDQRIQRGARRMCRDTGGPSLISVHNAQCYALAVNSARGQVDQAIRVAETARQARSRRG